MGDRVYLHVGVPKTGTTFVQDVLWRGRTKLARDGVCYPLRRRAEHFAATMDLRGASWGGRRNPDWDGTWDRLAGTVTESGAPTAVLSGELLAAADRTAVERAVRSFPDREVHVVVTVRDLARQLVSGWQEQVKHRVSVPLTDFVAGCLELPGASERALRLGSRFWPLHDLVDVVDRWGSGVPSASLHLVTVPPPGGPRELLWQRFADVTGVDPELGRVDTARPNTSLAASEAELLRRYNADHADDVSQTHYDQVVRALLAENVLVAGDRSGAGLVLPPAYADAVHDRSLTVVRTLAGRGHDVVGDLDDLVPDVAALRAGRTPVVGDDELADAAVRAVAGFVSELGPLSRRLKARQQSAPPSTHPPLPRSATSADLQTSRNATGGGVGEPGPVYLHVGAPKTGTTFLQDVMWHHRDALAESGVLFARRRYGDHFLASVDLRDVAEEAAQSAGSWDRVVADTSSWPGPSVISHELFASARPQHIARALESLGPDRVHVVYTARDLWRLLAAEWQEATKHGRSLSFAEYLDDVLDEGPEGTVGRWFWSVHDPTDVLQRWGADLPAERVHVVTVPAAGSDPTLLWRRFAGLVGIDPSVVDTSVARPNTSLGASEVTFLRRVNAELGGRRGGRLGEGEYGRFVKNVLAQEVLTERPDKATYLPPAERFDQVRAAAERFVAGIEAAGYHVVGDLDELLPPHPGAGVARPDDVTAAELVEVGLDALAGLVRKAASMREAHGIGVEARAPAPAEDTPSSPVGRAARLLRRAGAAITRRER